MSKVIITRGLQASGKSTWAKAEVAKAPNDWVRINKDDLRAMMCTKHSKQAENIVIKTRNTMMLAALANKKNVIIDDTNLALKHVRELTNLAETSFVDCDVEVKDFHISLREAILRDAKRPNGVGPKVIYKTWQQYIQRPVPAYNDELQDCILCDLDGTMCLFPGKNPYDRDFSQDDINTVVAGIVDEYCRETDVALIFTSGRKDSFRQVTKDWLESQGLNFYDALFMRDSSDNRDDYTVKKEIYENHIENNYNVRFVLDDRDKVVDLWRELGLTCLQVEHGAF